MKRYEFWFSVEETFKASFLANSDEDAKAMMEEIQADDYPNFEDFFGAGYWEKPKTIDTSIDVNSLEYIGLEVS